MKVKSDSSELEEKVAFLEKELSEHVNTIDKMKREMERRVSKYDLCTHYYSYYFTSSILYRTVCAMKVQKYSTNCSY